MKLNPDCIRDILIIMEDQPFKKQMDFDDLVPLLPSYSSDDIEYTCLKLKEAGFIHAITTSDFTGETVVTLLDITYTGHQFLNDIRSDTIWNNVKEVSKKVGSQSVSAISQIASGVITAIIKAQLGLI
ncbi:MAG TPA: DUF2513 domain-containing protein [Candidatus Blautia excrementipullorum]|nr:DUF2513 domain-containing protein [Candidatus Blautia excrementipullorum]